MQSPWLSPRIQNSTHQNPHGWQTPPADTPLGHGKATEKEEKRAVAGGRLSVGFRVPVFKRRQFLKFYHWYVTIKPATMRPPACESATPPAPRQESSHSEDDWVWGMLWLAQRSPVGRVPAMCPVWQRMGRHSLINHSNSARNFPGDPAVRGPSASIGDMSSAPGPGRPPHAARQRGLCTATAGPAGPRVHASQQEEATHHYGRGPAPLG